MEEERDRLWYTRTLNEYQNLAKETALPQISGCVDYMILGLLGEAGELANGHKKYLRGDFDMATNRLRLGDELGDVLWYVAMLADALELNLAFIAQKNVEKLRRRKDRDSLQGDGDNR